jgi:hypothetical protein
MTVASCSQPAAVNVVVIPTSASSGPRWIVIKAEGLSCEACAADLQADLAKRQELSQIEMFAPAPYCRFYVEDGRLDVPRLVEQLKREHAATLEGYAFIRGE